MASITVRNLGESVKRELKMRAARHGHSMEQEVREIINDALGGKPKRKSKTGADLYKQIRAIVEPLGGIEVEPFPDEPVRDPEWLKDWK